MKSKFIFVIKIPGGRNGSLYQEISQKIAEINRKTHEICRKRIRKYLLGNKLRLKLSISRKNLILTSKLKTKVRKSKFSRYFGQMFEKSHQKNINKSTWDLKKLKYI